MSWATHGRTATSANSRGNSKQRRIRKQWLLDTFGDGETTVCSFDDCDTQLDIETMTVDRFPIPGIEGGTYRKDNIRPACAPCNREHGLRLALAAAAAARAAKRAAAAQAVTT